MNQCICIGPPPCGAFEKGKIYSWSYCIDGIDVYDDNGISVDFGEIEFCYYFAKVKRAN